MPPPPVMIRVGGSIDATLGRSLRTAVDMVAQAEKNAQKSKRESSKVAEQEAARQIKAQERLTRAAEGLDRQRASALFRQYRQQEAAADRSAKAELRSRQRTEEAARREIEKTVRAAVKALEAEERAQARTNKRAGESFARRTSHRATRFLSSTTPLLPMAGRALRDVAHGLGVDTSLSGAIARGVNIDSAAVGLSNRGHIVGAQGANGQVVDPAALAAQARAVGKQTAVDPEQLLAAGHAFVGLTGDLDLWRKIMPEIAKQTAALGGNQEEAAKAAGEFAAHVGDIPNKEKAIVDLMRVAAGQGKIGGVDFSDFAKFASRAAAPAAQFAGDKAQNISKLTALAEIAKMHGGASNAAEAFTSVASLTNTLKKPARLKSIAALLGDRNGQFADAEHTTLKDPVELMRSLVIAGAKGNKDGRSSLDKVAKAIGDSRSLKAISGLQNTFNEAGGGAAGIAAMDAELKKFAGAVMSQEETNRALGAQLETTRSKAERFNQSLENIATGTRERLGPALDHLAPIVLGLAEKLGRATTWMIENPKTAIALAISASIARAGIESALRAGIERLLLGPGGANAGGLGAASGKLGAALTIASLGVTTLTVGMAIIDKLFTDAQNEQNAAVAKGANASNLQGEAGVLASKGDIKGAIAKERDAIDAKKQEMSATEGQKPGFWGKLVDLTMTNADQREALKSRDAAITRASQQQQRELVEMRAHLARLVEIAEAGGGAPGAPAGGGRVEQ